MGIKQELSARLISRIGGAFDPEDLEPAIHTFILFTLLALGDNRFWSPKLNQIVKWVISLRSS